MDQLNTTYRSFKKVIKKSPLFSGLYEKLHLLKFERIQQRYYSQLINLESAREEELRLLQNSMLLDLLRYANENTTYYNKLFRENNIDVHNFSNFNKIPFLTKDRIRTNMNELISKEYDRRYLIKKKTGGSTGSPLEFYCNAEAGMINHGHQLYQYRQLGYEKGDVIVGGGGTHVPEELRKKGIFWNKMNKNNISGSYIFSVIHLNESNIDRYVSKLLSLKPVIFRGHPTFYDAIAHYLLENDIVFDYKIKGVILTAEMCSEKQRRNIEKAFSTNVYFEYGHSEVCIYCYTKDSDKTYYSSPIYGYVEVLNDDNTPTKVGEVGHIVVTGFVNRAMPFIRYRTEDLARVSHRNGGMVQFSELFGRVQSFAISKKGKKVTFNPVIFGLLASSFTHIRKWQIVQKAVGIIEFYIVKGKGYNKKDEEEIEKIIQSRVEIAIDFIYVSSITPTKRGKHLFFIQKLKSAAEY